MDKSPPKESSGDESKTLILCDFDGTVSTKDTVNRLIRSHIDSPEWRRYVKRYMLGELGSMGVYEAVGPLMRMTQDDLDVFVRDHAKLDPGFPAFLDWSRSRGIDVKIVSDGFDATIKTLFRDHGIDGLEIYANSLIFSSDGAVELGSPHSDPDCGTCGTCKLSILNGFREKYDRIILVGDGESDRHAAEHADLVLALDDLFVYCARNGVQAIRVDGFSEIPHLLTRELAAVIFDMDGTLVDSIESITESFNHMFEALGYPLMTRDEVVRKTNISLLDFIASFLKPEEADRGLEIFREYYGNIYLDRTPPMPGALEALESLDGKMIAGVVTNKRGPYARSLAEHLGIADRFARVIGALDGFKAKPSGEMFEEFVRWAGVDKDRVVYVGDAPIDVEAARNGGVDCFVIANDVFSGEELALHKPRRVLSNMWELPAALRAGV